MDETGPVGKWPQRDSPGKPGSPYVLPPGNPYCLGNCLGNRAFFIA
jgi:hypothetical protein